MIKPIFFSALVGLLSVGSAQAAGIFNTIPAAPATAPAPSMAAGASSSTTSQAQVKRPAMSAYQPATPPEASVVPPMKADPKVMALFDRYPNEGDDAYVARMKVISDRAIADLERAGRANVEKMRALAPPPLKQ